MMKFYHDKGFDMLKLGCTLPNITNICLHKSTNHKFYPFFERDKNLCEQIREHRTGGPSIVFTRKAVFDQTYITQPDSRRKLTVFMLMVTGITVKQYLKQWVATIIFAHAKKPVHRCQNKILKREMRSEKWLS